MTKVGIVGKGRLGTLIREAIEAGKAPECELIGVASRSLGVSPMDLVAQGAQVLIEASKPDALKEFLPEVLAAGVSVIPLSTGAFADEAFLEKVRAIAREHGSKVILPHGAEGAFDLAATYSLGGNSKGTVVQYLPKKPPESAGNPMAAIPENWHGPILEGFALSPAHLNVLIAAGIACGGFDKAFYETREATEDKRGFALELENDYSKATLLMTGKPNAPFFGTIALSAIAALNRFVSPITF